MALSCRSVGIAALAAVCASASSRAADEQVFASHDVRIDVTVLDAGSAAVSERYLLDGSPETATFEVLEDPCSSLGPIAAAVDDRRLALEISHRGPWTIFRAAGTRADRDGRELHLTYGVRLDGAAVPIVLPAATLARARQSRGADVDLRVAWDGKLTRPSVLLPRLEQIGSTNTWQARLPAIPSVVRLAVPSMRSGCDRVLSGTAGGLDWRFWIFVATMGLWIPVYFWWFGGRDDSR